MSRGRKRSLFILVGLSLVATSLAGDKLLKWWWHPLSAEDGGVEDVEGLPFAEVFQEGVGERLAWARPLEDPKWRTVGDADHMKADDVVLGLEVYGGTWAIPWWIMKNHHVANLLLANRPVMVAFCEMCSSGSAFVPVLDGQRLHFRLAGVYNGSILIVDEETGTFWSPFAGDGLHGPLAGKTLQRIPLIQSYWSDWRELHPESRVAHGSEHLREGHSHASRPGTVGIGDRMKRSLLRDVDERLPHNELVLGAASGGETKAYPLDLLAQHDGPVNDTLGGEPIVVFHLPGSLVALAFSRRVGDDVVAFERTPSGEVRDVNTGSTWNYSGRATAGPLSGRTLTYVPSGVEEWYIWAAYKPDTKIFEDR